MDSRHFAAPYFSLARALWIPAVLTWGNPTGASRRVEGPQGLARYREAVQAALFLVRAMEAT